VVVVNKTGDDDCGFSGFVRAMDATASVSMRGGEKALYVPPAIAL
jgi:hypothetical protein